MDVSVDMHDYTLSAVTDPGFGNTLDALCSTHLPDTPTKPASKKGKMGTLKDVVTMLSSISLLINECSDYLEKLDKFSFAIDSVHRLGKKQNQIGSKSVPHAVIVQFTSLIVRDAVWKAAKSSVNLKDNRLRFMEDLTPLDRERRKKLWPMAEEARAAGKAAYYVGARAFINGIEISLPAYAEKYI
ncbi:Manganese-binding lipoprotein MntA [Labeo rohita]|uniref:Manganese-binding lipoprotein MntA n=1 Tax=Labeo rohita TaxID=84645 RepID=A0ABQ8L1V7_LABRO|nr:Manganese-binding lipoprotein MntA [Labeo rohita]